MYNFLRGSLRGAAAPVLKGSAVFIFMLDAWALRSCVPDSREVGLELASASPGGLVRTQILPAGSHPQSFWCCRPGVRPKNLHS